MFSGNFCGIPQKYPCKRTGIFSVSRMELFTHFSVIKTIFSFKVNVRKVKNIENNEELGKNVSLW
jgi:hypothetical protein